jgi:hypothetical protein
MATTTAERDLLALERKYWEALKDKDLDAALELTEDPCIITGAQGVGLLDRQTYESMMRNATWDILDFDIGDDHQVRCDPRLHRARKVDRRRRAGDDRRRKRVHVGAPRRPMAVRAAHGVDSWRSVRQGPHA